VGSTIKDIGFIALGVGGVVIGVAFTIATAPISVLSVLTAATVADTTFLSGLGISTLGVLGVGVGIYASAPAPPPPPSGPLINITFNFYNQNGPVPTPIAPTEANSTIATAQDAGVPPDPVMDASVYDYYTTSPTITNFPANPPMSIDSGNPLAGDPGVPICPAGPPICPPGDFC
jgi:hypothetical protein